MACLPEQVGFTVVADTDGETAYHAVNLVAQEEFKGVLSRVTQI